MPKRDYQLPTSEDTVCVVPVDWDMWLRKHDTKYSFFFFFFKQIEYVTRPQNMQYMS